MPEAEKSRRSGHAEAPIPARFLSAAARIRLCEGSLSRQTTGSSAFFRQNRAAVSCRTMFETIKQHSQAFNFTAQPSLVITRKKNSAREKV